MRKIILALLYLLIPFAILAEDMVVTIAIRDCPPFEFIENGKTKGINYDTISDVLKRAGYEAKFIPLPWKRAISLVEAGGIDAVASIRTSPQHEERLIFSAPIMYTQDYFFKKKTFDIKIKDMSELAPYSIGLVDQYFYEEAFNKKNFPKLDLITSLSPEVDNLEKLKAGRLGLAVCSINICNYWMKKYPKLFNDIDYIKSPVADSVRSLHIAFSRKNSSRSEEIVEKFNKALAEYIAEEGIKKNIAKYDPDAELAIIQE